MTPAPKFLSVLIFVICFVIVFHPSDARIFHQGRFWKHGLLPPPKVDHPPKLPEARFVTQRLDNFNPADTRTWKQRYFVNDTFFRPGGPVFLMVGGEGTANPIWSVFGTWIKYAETFSALCFQLEHRYYGESHPVPDLGTKNLAYLSSEQALADLASFVEQMKGEWNLTGNQWITFGGSYPGSLSAWARLKYPHLIHGAVSASAPLLAQMNFPEYMEVVEASILSEGGQNCAAAIAVASNQVRKLLGHQVGWATLKKKFNLCHKLDARVEADVWNLMSSLAGNFEGVVQYDHDNREFEGVKGANITVSTLCDIMRDKSGSPLDNYARVNQLMLDVSGEKCLDHEYKALVKDLVSIDWNSSASEGGRQWMYQTCSEFGYYQTSDKSKMFGNDFPLKYFIQQCVDVFGKKFDESFIAGGVTRTNAIYGAKDISVTRVAFFNGVLDPWHALGIVSVPKTDASVKAFYVPGAAHCANMYPERPEDSAALKSARRSIEDLIHLWLLDA